MNDSERLIARFPENAKDPHSWAAKVEAYADDVENGDGSVEILGLVQWIASQEFSRMFRPSRSHSKLSIETKDQVDKKHHDSVLIWHDEDLNVYQINYYEGTNQKPEKRRCKESEIHELIELKLLRIKLVAETAV